MEEIVANPTRLVTNQHTVVFRVGEDDDYKFAATEYAKFIAMAFWVFDEESGEEICTMVNTYSLN